MFCPSCGNEIVDNVSFCPKCGAALSKKAQEKERKKASNPITASVEPENKVQNIYSTEDGTTVYEYCPWPYNKIEKHTSAVYISDYYVTVNGDSIDRAHISGTKQYYIRNDRMGKISHICFALMIMFFMVGITLITSLFEGVNFVEFVPCFLILAVLPVTGCYRLWLKTRAVRDEYKLVIKGSGSADAICISTNKEHCYELDAIETAVRALAISHDNDTNVRVQGAMNRAYSEYQTDRIIDAINRK